MDLHQLTASRVLNANGHVSKDQRQAAKAINFGFMYGMGVPRFRQNALSSYGVVFDEDQAKTYRSQYFKSYPGMRAWQREQGKGPDELRTLAKRRRLQVLKYTEKLNTPIQGTRADGLKSALALLFERRAQVPSAFPVLVVH